MLDDQEDTEVTNEEEDTEEDDVDIADVMDVRRGVTVVEFGTDTDQGGPVETVIGGVGEEYGGCVDRDEGEDDDEDEEDEEDVNDGESWKRIVRKRKRKLRTPFDEITGEFSEAFLRLNPNTLRCKRITLERDRRQRHLMETVHTLDQFVVESFVHTYHGYEIAKKWSIAHPDKPIEFMDPTTCTNRMFTPDMREIDLPHWKRYCMFTPPYMGEIDEREKLTESPRIEGALTRIEREDRERKRPWYKNPNSLRPEDRICVLKTLDKMIVQAYVKTMDSIEHL